MYEPPVGSDPTLFMTKLYISQPCHVKKTSVKLRTKNRYPAEW